MLQLLYYPTHQPTIKHSPHLKKRNVCCLRALKVEPVYLVYPPSSSTGRTMHKLCPYPLTIGQVRQSWCLSVMEETHPSFFEPGHFKPPLNCSFLFLINKKGGSPGQLQERASWHDCILPIQNPHLPLGKPGCCLYLRGKVLWVACCTVFPFFPPGTDPHTFHS